MPLDQVGTLVWYRARVNVTSDDTAYPSGNQAGSIEVPDGARGSITHVFVDVDGSGTGVQARVTLFGRHPTTGWGVLAQLNSGAAITRTTNTPVADGNDIHYYETFSHISSFTRLYPLIESTASLTNGVTVYFAFEQT